MTTNQLFFAIASMIVAVLGVAKWYIDAKIDPIGAEVKTLINYLMLHEG
jgi:hypothetical protein